MIGTHSARQRLVAVAVVTAMGLSIAGVAGAATQPRTSAPPVDIWAIAPIGLPAENVFQTPAGAQVAAKYIDSHGGLGSLHQQLVVKQCNTQGTPNGELQCAQEATSDSSSIGVVEPIVVRDPEPVTSLLLKDGLPAINPFVNAPPDFVSPINFPLWSPNFASAACAVLASKATGLKKIGFATLTLPISIDTQNAAISAAKKAGLTSVGSVELPITSTDLTPFVRQLQQKHPQLVVISFPPFLTGSWLSAAAQLGATVPTCIQDGLTDYQTLAGLGSSVGQFYLASFIPDVYANGYPLITQFRAQATAAFNAGNKSASLAPTSSPQLTLNAWLATQVVVQASANVHGVITRSKFLAALNHTTVHFGSGNQQVLPPINFAHPNPDKKYSRLFNTRIFLKKWDIKTKSFVTVTNVSAVFGDKLVP